MFRTYIDETNGASSALEEMLVLVISVLAEPCGLDPAASSDLPRGAACRCALGCAWSTKL